MKEEKLVWTEQEDNTPMLMRFYVDDFRHHRVWDELLDALGIPKEHQAGLYTVLIDIRQWSDYTGDANEVVTT
ncbi:MAG: hypothetical protein ACXACF_01635 [Candidatus Hermodarchaeia archaeon]|jgi:hypothetical protein